MGLSKKHVWITREVFRKNDHSKKWWNWNDICGKREDSEPFQLMVASLSYWSNLKTSIPSIFGEMWKSLMSTISNNSQTQPKLSERCDYQYTQSWKNIIYR